MTDQEVVGSSLVKVKNKCTCSDICSSKFSLFVFVNYRVVDPPTNSQDSGWELDWIEPSTSMLQPRGSQNVYDAFCLLQTESSVQVLR